MNKRFSCISERGEQAVKWLAPFWDISKSSVLFCVTLFTAYYMWKVSVIADPASPEVYCLGYDLTSFFTWISKVEAKTVVYMLNAVGRDYTLDGTVIVGQEGVPGIRILWGCTAVKQFFIFACLMFVAPGNQRKKVGYFLKGILAIYLLNLVRLGVISCCVGKNVQLFEPMHRWSYWMMYAFLYLLWIIWNDFMCNCRKKER